MNDERLLNHILNSQEAMAKSLGELAVAQASLSANLTSGLASLQVAFAGLRQEMAEMDDHGPALGELRSQVGVHQSRLDNHHAEIGDLRRIRDEVVEARGKERLVNAGIAMVAAAVIGAIATVFIG